MFTHAIKVSENSLKYQHKCENVIMNAYIGWQWPYRTYTVAKIQ
jgi:hypothetical protein